MNGAPKGAGAPAGTADSSPRKTRRLGDYELIGKLGQGAMGSVYLARQLSIERKVALKILPRDMAKDEEFLERFRREARAASKLAHPNIVAAYDIGFADDYHYIAMEYVEGHNLESILHKKGRLDEQTVLKIAHNMASALEAAEEKGIVHRDIKPANILMNQEGVAKLTDLGLASASHGDQRVTMAGFAVGTPYYISPEQARGELDVDGRADIYSLGATLYHLVTGALPFDGSNPVTIMTQHLKDDPVPPHVKQPGVSQHISLLIQRMMAKDPLKRYQKAAHLKSDIERCQRGEAPGLGKPALAAGAHAEPAATVRAASSSSPPTPAAHATQSQRLHQPAPARGTAYFVMVAAIALVSTLALLAVIFFVAKQIKSGG